MQEISKNTIYRHFKGNLYFVEDIAEHTETGEQMIIYRALYGSNKLYARPLAMFASKVDREKYPDTNGFGPILYAHITTPTVFTPAAFTTIESAGNKSLSVYIDGKSRARFHTF